jgi:undecaprenyl phosphate-alpha-L-ara4N flippase subunit ArnF
MKGYGWGAASVVLVTCAQLLMKWGMMQLPLFSLPALSITLLAGYIAPLSAVICGVFAYALSMMCWFFALRQLPLNRAYPLLSISYALVYLAAVILPWFNESLHWLKTVGTLCILLGIWLIYSKPAGIKRLKAK